MRVFGILKQLFLLFFLLGALASCSSTTNLSSIDLDACFLSYESPDELKKALDEASEVLESDNPSISFMAVAGCLNYQLGNYTQAEEWLQRAFTESEEDSTKNLAASALGLIYLHENQQEKIEPYIEAVDKNALGRWLLVLYYLEFYRETNQKDYLSSAITKMEEKHEVEGKTSATDRFLSHMRLISQMEAQCRREEEPENSSCLQTELEDEKLYLFSTANGFLSMLLKKRPFTQTKLYVGL